MPSTKNPNSLATGPGKIPASVSVSAANLFPVTYTSSSSIAVVVVNPTGPVALDRSSNLMVLVQTDAAGWSANDTITLPSGAIIGDRVAVVDAPGNSSLKSIVVIDPLGTIDGKVSVSIEQNYGTLVMVNIATNKWAVESQTVAIEPVSLTLSINDTTAMTRLGVNTIVAVDTAHANWTTGDTLTLPSGAVVGDRINIQDSTGSANSALITVDTSGGATINGLTSAMITKNYGSLVVVLTATNQWTTSSADLSVYQMVTGATVLTRRAPEMSVMVQTSGSWVAGNTVTLPSSAQVGDRVLIKDVDGNAETDFITVAGGSSTIEGESTVTLRKNYESVEFQYLDMNLWDATPHSYIVEVSDSVVMVAGQGLDTIIQVHTSAGTWTSADTITLNSSFKIGDYITILDVDGNAATDPITIVGGTSTINGLTSTSISETYGSMTLRYAAANSWVLLTRPNEDPSTQAVNATGPTDIVITSDRQLVEVDTSHASWVGGGTVNLPDGYLGDQIVVTDIGGNAEDEPITVDASPGTINGVSSFPINSNYGYVTLRRGTAEWYITSKPVLGATLTTTNTVARLTNLIMNPKGSFDFGTAQNYSIKATFNDSIPSYKPNGADYVFGMGVGTGTTLARHMTCAPYYHHFVNAGSTGHIADVVTADASPNTNNRIGLAVSNGSSEYEDDVRVTDSSQNFDGSFSSANRVLRTGTGRILRIVTLANQFTYSDDNLASFSAGVTHPLGGLQEAGYSTDTGTVIIAGLNGSNLEVARSTDDGLTFGTLQSYGVGITVGERRILAVLYDALNNTFQVHFRNSDGGTEVFRSTDDGATFTNTGIVDPLLTGISITPTYADQHVSAYVGNGVTVTLTYASNLSSDNVPARLHTSTDGGLTWSNHNLGPGPGTPGGEGWSLTYGRYLYLGNPDNTMVMRSALPLE